MPRSRAPVAALPLRDKPKSGASVASALADSREAATRRWLLGLLRRALRLLAGAAASRLARRGPRLLVRRGPGASEDSTVQCRDSCEAGTRSAATLPPAAPTKAGARRPAIGDEQVGRAAGSAGPALAITRVRYRVAVDRGVPIRHRSEDVTRSLLGDAAADGLDGRLDAVVEVEFGEDAGDVVGDGVGAQRELAGDVLVALAAGQPRKIWSSRAVRAARIALAAPSLTAVTGCRVRGCGPAVSRRSGRRSPLLRRRSP